MKGREYLVALGCISGKGMLTQASTCIKGDILTQVVVKTSAEGTTLNCENLVTDESCAIDDRVCGITRKIISAKEEITSEAPDRFRSVRAMVSLTNELRSRIQEPTRFINVPGQGPTIVSNITYPDGDKGELGWSRIRDEKGALVWTKGIANLLEGNYCVIYVDPYDPYIIACELRDNGEKVLGIDWEDLNDLYSLLDEKRES